MDIFLQPRWYPLGSVVDKLFVGAMLGYGLWLIPDYYNEEPPTIDGTFIYGGAVGWKFTIGKFGIEPWLGYTSTWAFQIGVSLGIAW